MTMIAQHVFQRLALGAAKGFLAEHVENFAERGAAAAFDLAVELDEGNAQALGKQAAEGGLAAAAQADQRDAPTMRILGHRIEVLGDELARFYEHVRRQPFEKLAQQYQV